MNGRQVSAKVRRNNPRILNDLLRRALSDDRAEFEGKHAIRDPHDELHVVFDHQYRTADFTLDALHERAERLGFTLRDTR